MTVDSIKCFDCRCKGVDALGSPQQGCVMKTVVIAVQTFLNKIPDWLEPTYWGPRIKYVMAERTPEGVGKFHVVLFNGPNGSGLTVSGEHKLEMVLEAILGKGVVVVVESLDGETV